MLPLETDPLPSSRKIKQIYQIRKIYATKPHWRGLCIEPQDHQPTPMICNEEIKWLNALIVHVPIALNAEIQANIEILAAIMPQVWWIFYNMIVPPGF